ncbi:CLUMA_CG021174, isoform A [Clunio marinus]|uniref:CLUMA_CG021174, isoform A n=1 Tax=Clunio marinus TaxID=568069 RepID=A0A1J1J654_9DIPT|nr:CLUMA_CG021174, isoform A [Clunio marinus]
MKAKHNLTHINVITIAIGFDLTESESLLSTTFNTKSTDEQRKRKKSLKSSAKLSYESRIPVLTTTYLVVQKE